MNKYILAILLFIAMVSCNTVMKINGFGENDYICRKYDSENNITYVYDLTTHNNIKVKGKWRYAEREKYGDEHYISHCPRIINNEKAQLELWCRPNETDNWKRKTNLEMLTAQLKQQIPFWNIDYKLELLSTNDDTYAIYSFKKKSVERTALIGYKNGNYYHIELFNDSYDERQRTFLLLQVFNDN